MSPAGPDHSYLAIGADLARRMAVSNQISDRARGPAIAAVLDVCRDLERQRTAPKPME